MTLTERDFAMLPQKEGIPPPVNNACVPDIFNKLDADCIERTRVINSQLELRLSVQERVLGKYKTAAEQRYKRERDRVCKDLRNIVRRLPNYADIPRLETKINKIKKRKRRSNISAKHNCVYTTEPLDMKGLADGKDDKPYCDRYFSHHLPTKSKFYKDVLPSVRKGASAPDLRPRPTVGIQNIFPLRPQNVDLQSIRSCHTDGLRNELQNHPSIQSSLRHQNLDQESLQSLEDSIHNEYPLRTHNVDMLVTTGQRLPTIHAMDDNFVTRSYSHIHDDDETKTV